MVQIRFFFLVFPFFEIENLAQKNISTKIAKLISSTLDPKKNNSPNFLPKEKMTNFVERKKNTHSQHFS
jgi:hypothetical protein